MKIKNYVKNRIKCISTCFLLGTCFLQLIALILYLNFGTSIFIPNLSSKVIIVMILSVIMPLFVALSPLKIIYTLVYALNILSCLLFIESQISFVANVLVGIDGTTFPLSFILIIGCTLISSVFSVIAMSKVSESFGNQTQEA